MPVKHAPSNANETNILLDAYAEGQLAGKPSLVSPDSIEMNTDKGLQTFDPGLVAPEVLQRLTQTFGKPYGPAPQEYGGLAEAIAAQGKPGLLTAR